MSDLTTLSNDWQTLRGSDNQEGKIQVLKSVGEILGKQGTPANLVLTTLGQPDELKPSLAGSAALPTMPGPVISSEPSQDVNNEESLYFIYYAGPNRTENYLYFKVDGSESIVKSEWK